jgi:hypothetical protein
MEPADVRVELLHRLAAVDVVPAEDEDVLQARGTVEEGGYGHDVGRVEVMEIACGAFISHLHPGF